MQSGKLQNALKNLRAAIKDVEAAVEEMRAEKDSLAGLPSVMWSVVLQGAALVIGITYLLRVQHAIQFVLTGCLAMFIGLVVFVIASLDQPLSGPLAIDSKPYQIVRDRLIDLR